MVAKAKRVSLEKELKTATVEESFALFDELLNRSGASAKKPAIYVNPDQPDRFCRMIVYECCIDACYRACLAKRVSVAEVWMKSPDFVRRIAAAHILSIGDCKGDEPACSQALQLIKRLVEDPVPAVVLAAFGTFGTYIYRFRGRPLLPIFERIGGGHADPGVRLKYVKLLRDWWPKKAAEVLVRLTRDPAVCVRAEACSQLQWFDFLKGEKLKAVTEALTARLDDGELAVRFNANFALRCLGREPEPLVDADTNDPEVLRDLADNFMRTLLTDVMDAGQAAFAPEVATTDEKT